MVGASVGCCGWRPGAATAGGRGQRARNHTPQESTGEHFRRWRLLSAQPQCSGSCPSARGSTAIGMPGSGVSRKQLKNGRPLPCNVYERRQSHRLVLRRMRALWSPELPHWRYQLNAKGRFLPDGRPAVVVHGHLWRSAPPPQAVARCVLLRLARAWRSTAAHRLHPKISDALWWPCAGHRSPVYEAQLRCRSGRARATLFGRLRRCHPRIAPLPLLLRRTALARTVALCCCRLCRSRGHGRSVWPNRRRLAARPHLGCRGNGKLWRVCLLCEDCIGWKSGCLERLHRSGSRDGQSSRAAAASGELGWRRSN